jgi:Calpain family cysteine protease
MTANSNGNIKQQVSSTNIVGKFSVQNSSVVSFSLDDMNLLGFSGQNAMVRGSFFADDSEAYGATAITVKTPVIVQTQAVYVTETGNTNAISVTDVNQGQIGDCYFLSPLIECAAFHPSTIMDAIKINSDGTETVTLYTDSNGKPVSFNTKTFKQTSVTVTNTFQSNSVNNGSTQAILKNLTSSTKEIWPSIMEKAFAQLYGGYNAISNGGFPTLAMETLTGKEATATTKASSMSEANITSLLNSGAMLTVDTFYANSIYNTVGHHCYAITGQKTINGVLNVAVTNPWGVYAPGTQTSNGTGFIPISKMSSIFVELDVGHF